jgi:hypothetical protein
MGYKYDLLVVEIIHGEWEVVQRGRRKVDRIPESVLA